MYTYNLEHIFIIVPTNIFYGIGITNLIRNEENVDEK